MQRTRGEYQKGYRTEPAECRDRVEWRTSERGQGTPPVHLSHCTLLASGSNCATEPPHAYGASVQCYQHPGCGFLCTIASVFGELRLAMNALPVVRPLWCNAFGGGPPCLKKKGHPDGMADHTQRGKRRPGRGKRGRHKNRHRPEPPGTGRERRTHTNRALHPPRQ